MKKIIALALAMTAMISMAACGGSTSLVNKTVNGISMDMPSDIGEFKTEDITSTGQADGAIIAIMEKLEVGMIERETLDEKSYAMGIIGNETVEIVNYDNNATCAGLPAIRADYKGKSTDGDAMITYSYMIFHPDGMGQVIFVGCLDTEDNFVKKNIDAILGSIKLA